MRIRIPALLAAGLTLAATPAAAQHCWPSMIALVVRDADGAVINPAPLMRDSVRYSPARGETADFVVRRALIRPLDTNRFDQPGGMPVIAWYGQGACRVDMREVVVRARGKVMRLWMDLHIDTQARPGSSSFLLKAPPLADGTWRLDVCALPEGESHVYTPIPTRWVRVSPSGDPGIPWQPPQGCAGGAPR
jgi:hypothetical protein